MNPNDPPLLDKINELIELVGAKSDDYEGELAQQLIQTALKLLIDKTDLGQMKLMTRAVKEMRYAFKTFSHYPATRRVSIFGSARTPEMHLDYEAALEFSRLMAAHGWACMTGAAEGIMKAGLEGVEHTHRYGLSILLPWETGANPLIEKDPKLMMFRYFFTRKLMFVSNSDAFAAFPGGFGTMDELFEVLTLMQTGKAEIMPVVLVEGEKRDYWKSWEEYIKEHLLKNGWISPMDTSLYHIAKDPEDACRHILHFYSNFHSYRYVKDHFVIRLNKELTSENLKSLTAEFSSLIQSGEIEKTARFPEEDDVPDLPRITFIHTRKDYSLMRALIDRINEL